MDKQLFKVFVSVDYIQAHKYTSQGIKPDMQPLLGQSQSLSAAKLKAAKASKEVRVSGQNARMQILNLTTGEIYTLLGGTWVLDTATGNK